jgi:hypothetical protein
MTLMTATAVTTTGNVGSCLTNSSFYFDCNCTSSRGTSIHHHASWSLELIVKHEDNCELHFRSTAAVSVCLPEGAFVLLNLPLSISSLPMRKAKR